MVFLGVYRATYDYTPQAEGELEIQDGDLLFVLEKGEDDWWRAKKKAPSEDEEEPEGLIPNNYVEEASPIGTAKALYDYARQTDEEISFEEEAELEVYDASDEDWTLIGYNGEFGFAPANYIEIHQGKPGVPSRPPQPRAAPEPEPEEEDEPAPLPTRHRVRTPSSDDSPTPSPAAALAGIIQSRGTAQPAAGRSQDVTAPARGARRVQFTPEESEEEAPPPNLPRRTPSMDSTSAAMSGGRSASKRYDDGVAASPQTQRPKQRSTDYEDDTGSQSQRGFHIYNIYEMVEVMGKNKKMPITLGINVGKGVIMISPEQSKDASEWTADKLTHYALEGKHVFMELVRPSKSIDFHAGQKDTAQEIVSHLGELAGAAKAAGLKEVMAAGSGADQKKGKVLYDFMAAGDDEVTCAADDEVVILDDTNDEWWLVRRVANNKRGVVPSNYVEITGSINNPSGLTAKPHVSFVEQNRREEERLAKQAARSKRDSREAEVGSGLQLPQRNSSLGTEDNKDKSSYKNGKRDGKDSKPADKKSMPDKSKCRTWTDRSGSFKVEAEFLGLKDGKIHLHKLNGVKIAVPVSKMSIEDLEYVEWATGVSLDEDKPLSDIKRRNTQRDKDRPKNGDSRGKVGASLSSNKPEYDWFDFFLACGVNPQICERYASAFNRDQMGEENLVDISPQLLRTLGLKEGDILRVMKHLDSKFDRSKAVSPGEEGDANVAGGLFSGPGGALRNNTRKGRPAAPQQTLSSDFVDTRAFEAKAATERVSSLSEAKSSSNSSAPPPKADLLGGFDDNAWEPRGKSTPAVSPQPTTQNIASAASLAPAATSSMAELSLLSAPLQPERTAASSPPAAQPAAPVQPQGATPSLFEQLAKSPANPALQANKPGLGQGGLIAPPPPRAASAPQNQQSAFNPPPLQAQLTGYQPPNVLQAQPVPPGQSMDDQLLQQRLQQQQRLMQQQTGFQPTNFAFAQQPGLLPQQTGYLGQQYPGQQQQQFSGFLQSQPTGYGAQMQPGLMNGQQNGSPFADPPRAPFMPQPTGFQNAYNPAPLQPQQTGINAFLPPALVPQPTGLTTPQPSFNPTGFNQPPPPVPPIPQNQQNLQPLVAQKTGPPPPVRFGVGGGKKLVPQPTGRKANLSQATPQNPFGF